jgi:nitroreductase
LTAFASISSDIEQGVKLPGCKDAIGRFAGASGQNLLLTAIHMGQDTQDTHLFVTMDHNRKISAVPVLLATGRIMLAALLYRKASG